MKAFVRLTRWKIVLAIIILIFLVWVRLLMASTQSLCFPDIVTENPPFHIALQDAINAVALSTGCPVEGSHTPLVQELIPIIFILYILLNLVIAYVIGCLAVTLRATLKKSKKR